MISDKLKIKVKDYKPILKNNSLLAKRILHQSHEQENDTDLNANVIPFPKDRIKNIGSSFNTSQSSLRS